MAVEEKEAKQRTTRQNRAIHLMFTHMAQSLNDAGMDMKRTLRPNVDIPWSPETVKQYLWKPIQKAQLDKESTTELSTTEVDDVLRTLNRYFGEKHGMTFELPSVETIMEQQRLKDK